MSYMSGNSILIDYKRNRNLNAEELCYCVLYSPHDIANIYIGVVAIHATTHYIRTKRKISCIFRKITCSHTI